MKLPLALTLLTYVTIAASASAATLNPDFAYDFLSGGKIGYCPGVAPRVIAVGAVGATRSGGCCGTDEMWTQAFFDHGARWVPRRNIRADVEGGVRAFDLRPQKFDAGLAKLVPDAAALVEQLPIRNGKVSACISKLDLENVNQIRNPAHSEITFDIAIKYFVALDTGAGRRSLLVQEAAGQKKVSSTFFELYYDYNPRGSLFMSYSWAPLQDNLSASLQPIENAEADQGMAALSGYLGEFIGRSGQ